MTEQMKPSGIAWIGDVPQSWNLLKLKYFSYLKGRIGWQGLTADEFIDEGPFLITGTDFENGRIQFDRSYHISEKRYEEAPEIQLSVGDLLVTKDGTVGKMAYVDELPGKSSLNSHLLLIRPLNNKFDNRFLFWLMGSSVFTGYTDYAQDGTVMASLSQEKIGNFLAYFPPLREQQAIADYLDAQCAKIDSIASGLEKQIELLQKYKKSLITETVTKGLDKSVPMKDSGIEWIGKIPEHWKTSKIKYRFCTVNGSTPDSNDFDNWDGNIHWITPADMKETGLIDQGERNITIKGYSSCGTTMLPKGSIIISTRAPIGKINISSSELCTNQGCKSLVKEDDNRYYYYLLLSCQEQLIRLGRGTTFLELSSNDLKSLPIIIPPKEEQVIIANYLDNKCARIDELMSDKTDQLATIQQHKKSLIYEYVTGKKRVKEAEQWQSKAAN